MRKKSLAFGSSGVAKKTAKIGLNAAQAGLVAAGKVTGLIDFPVPPNSSMRKTGTRTIHDYFISGIRSYLPIAVCALREGVRLDQGIRVLDFGCGVGRQLLHFTRDYPTPEYHACDIDDTSVAFIQRSYPAVKASVSPFTPPLKYPNAYFDMIYSVSIFSHLNMDDQPRWLAELARVCKPGGYCMLTTEGFVAMRSLARAFGMADDQASSRLEAQGFMYKEYPDWREDVRKQNTLRIASNLVGVERSYGNTVLSPSFIRSNWGQAGFDVKDIVEGVIDRRQDLVVLRRQST